MKKETLVLDIDGVVLDWTKGFMKWMHYDRNQVPQAEVTNYNMAQTWPNINQDELAMHIDEFNMSPEFACLSILPGADMFVRMFRQQYPEIDLVAVTCAGHHPKTHLGRLKNLESLDFDEITILPLRASKIQKLTEIASRGFAVFTDDSPRYVIEGSKIPGLKTYCFSQPWNTSEVLPPEVAGRIDWNTAYYKIMIAFEYNRRTQNGKKTA
jgi:hypothetical protein